MADLNGKIGSHVRQGGTIDKVTILSTASNTGLKTDQASKDKFTKMMKDAGFPEYSTWDNMTTDAGGEGEFTIDQVKTTDQALAVARGKLLVKKLAMRQSLEQDDKIEYKFAVRGTDKIVNISAQGTSPDTKGEDQTIAGTVDDKLTTKERGKKSHVFPMIMDIKMVKRGVVSKIGDKIGTSKSSRRKRKA